MTIMYKYCRCKNNIERPLDTNEKTLYVTGMKMVISEKLFNRIWAKLSGFHTRVKIYTLVYHKGNHS